MINCRPVHGVRHLSPRDPELDKWKKKVGWIVERGAKQLQKTKMTYNNITQNSSGM